MLTAFLILEPLMSFLITLFFSHFNTLKDLILVFERLCNCKNCVHEGPPLLWLQILSSINITQVNIIYILTQQGFSKDIYDEAFRLRAFPFKTPWWRGAPTQFYPSQLYFLWGCSSHSLINYALCWNLNKRRQDKCREAQTERNV